ncbi:MAG: type II toxin-antitoxin system RelE/ParE family toxin [Sulfurovum sp.]|nr:type II toxin-antitoxin system RelE/ParE family toxin [Sulfurovum sp.]
MKHLTEYSLNMKIRFTKEALHNLEEIADFIYQETKSKDIAVKHMHKLRVFTKVSLEDFPKLGRPAEEFGSAIRKLVYQRYCILYMIQKTHIDIIAVYRDNLPTL